jgi:uncharacterized protein with HEPN domain
MQPEVVEFLQDALAAGEEIQSLTAAMSYDGYLQARVVRLAVERQFITIGEALNNAIHADDALAARITTARAVVDFRNLLVHGYSIVRNDRVWETITNDLPLLLSEVRSLLSAT